MGHLRPESIEKTGIKIQEALADLVWGSPSNASTSDEQRRKLQVCAQGKRGGNEALAILMVSLSSFSAYELNCAIRVAEYCDREELVYPIAQAAHHA